jgi:hypothetical protein
MADENGRPKTKTKRPPDRSILKESEISRPGLEKYALPGPWTQADEEWFEWTTEMFGGAPERDPDL